MMHARILLFSLAVAMFALPAAGDAVPTHLLTDLVIQIGDANTPTLEETAHRAQCRVADAPRFANQSITFLSGASCTAACRVEYGACLDDCDASPFPGCYDHCRFDLLYPCYRKCLGA